VADTDLSTLVMLSLLPIGARRLIGEPLRAGEPPAAILDRLLERRLDQPDTASALSSDAVRALERARRAGITPIAWTDAAYPPALAAIVDPPPVLWVRGSAHALDRPAVAIVGSRAGSPYALAVAERLAADLASRGLVVVSGLARGVDSAAHRGALAAFDRAPAADERVARDAALATVAVLGSGVDIVYPAEHRGLATEIAERGAVVSELPPGTPPLPWFFPLRNRIISGLSRAVVVIEAGEKSGSLITARCALEQGRDVLAVPGNVLSGRNRGAHALLRDGAKIVETADDILEELGPSIERRSGSRPEQAARWRGAAAAHDPVLAALPAGEPCDLDLISERSGLAPARLLPRLFELEMQGVVARVGGGRFVRFDRTC
jgi:DNA processing protein